MKQHRGSWGSNMGFILAAIGSAVGLGNIWGFPYKMGKSGGFTFLVVYAILAIFVGFVVMATELAMGRKTGKGIVGAFCDLSQKFKWVGWLGVIAPFFLLCFYVVLGGYCLEYVVINITQLFGAEALSGSASFGAMVTNPIRCMVYTFIFTAINFFIVRGGIQGGIEKFSTVGMPALFVMLVVVIIRSLTLPNAIEGVKFMFVPGYAVSAGFISESPSFINILSTAGGQMFFSLSLAMGIMITYGSYLGKQENLLKNSGIIVFADTFVAIMAGLAVIPAAVSNGIANGVALSDIQLGGPNLLFVTLQDVFVSMGTMGSLFGVVFYVLVLIAAISSVISLIEVIATMFMDDAHAKNKEGNRQKIVMGICLAFFAVSLVVAADGLGSNGVWVPFQSMLTTVAADGTVSMPVFVDCWLDFLDCLAEGIAMPLGALLMSLMVGFELGPETILPELHTGTKFRMDKFYIICIKYVVPVAMVFILLGQLSSFFGFGWFA
ncbi:sodium-dependent transporter [Bengtsoniella intestinalis]|uniref:sodium-dependent transporter n=1 Tax=Bengtsoniella intestinalis TaxID=3073143 RepID=UPI00391FC810